MAGPVEPIDCASPAAVPNPLRCSRKTEPLSNKSEQVTVQAAQCALGNSREAPLAGMTSGGPSLKAAPQAAPHAPPAPHGCAPSSKQLRFRFKGTLRVMASSWGTVRSYRLSACTAAGAARQALRRRCQQANGWPPGLPLLPLLPPFPQAPCPTPNTHTRQACACVVRYALRTADCPHLGASLEVVGAAGSGTKHRWRGPSAAHLPPLSTPPCLFTCMGRRISSAKRSLS